MGNGQKIGSNLRSNFVVTSIHEFACSPRSLKADEVDMDVVADPTTSRFPLFPLK